MKPYKKLQEMTLEELWHLFPITLAPHRTEWITIAREEIALLRNILSLFSPEINHIGSTAIPAIQAKPIVDILVTVPPESDFARMKHSMESAGYICMSENCRRMSFNKGYTPEGYAENVFHIHIHMHDDDNEIIFRDYLLTHHDTAKEYEALKQKLSIQYRYDRDGYTKAKTEFIRHIVKMAKENDGK